MRGGGFVWDMSSACVQGGLPRPLGGYQPNLIMEPHSPAPAWQLHHPIVPKQEPMEEDRNDSGTGSDFHSSSPGSENSHDYNPPAVYSSSQNTQTSQAPTYYTGPLIPTSPPVGYHPNLPMQLSYQPVTPLSSKNIQVPRIPTSESSPMPPTEKPPVENPENEDPLRRLQLTLEKNGLTAPSSLSPKTSEHSVDEDNKSEYDGDEYDEQGLRAPRMNSHGKIKTHKCKQCCFVAVTKIDFWEHSRTHIKPDKLLTCTRCPFVTEFKHHLEYHLRNHAGSKPFKCTQCTYTCVNKSMLNSHMKSHSGIYQYRCADCSYASKYCHSLKLHLRKYHHKPDMVLNPDGTPNPLPIIDVYGTRRGPKQRSSNKIEEPDSPTNVLHNQFAHFMLNASPQMQIPFPYHFLAGFPNPMVNPLLFSPALEDLAKKREEPFEQVAEREQPPEPPYGLTRSPSPAPEPQTLEALDLTKPEPSPTGQPAKNRRKGPAFKLENLPVSESDDEEEPPSTLPCGEEKRSITPPKDSSRSITLPKDSSRSITPPKDFSRSITPPKDSSPTDKMEEVIINNNNNNNNNSPTNSCQYCNISFGDIVLYTIHMGYHGYNDPFTCNMCGEECSDKVSFFVHMARTSHS